MEDYQRFNLPLAEVLSVAPARIPSESGGSKAMGILTIRPSAVFFTSIQLLLTQQQLLRLRDDLDVLLGDSQSWLYLSPEEQEELKWVHPE